MQPLSDAARHARRIAVGSQRLLDVSCAARGAMLCASFITAAACPRLADAIPAPAPYYARADAWAAWPGRPLERINAWRAAARAADP